MPLAKGGGEVEKVPGAPFVKPIGNGLVIGFVIGIEGARGLDGAGLVIPPCKDIKSCSKSDSSL